MYKMFLSAGLLLALVACGDAKPDAAELRAEAAKADAVAEKAEVKATQAAAEADAKGLAAAEATRTEWLEYQAATWNPNWDKFYASTDAQWSGPEYTIERTKDTVTVTRVAEDKDQSRVEDSLVAAAINAQYVTDKDVKAHRISVEVVDNVVHLRGKVKDIAEAREAVRLAINTKGAHRVVSHLTIG